MATADYRIINRCDHNDSFDTDDFSYANGKVSMKAASIKPQNLSAISKMMEGVFTVAATTSTAMTTNASFFGSWVAPAAGYVSAAYYVPITTVTGTTTDTYSVVVLNKGSGSGTTECVRLTLANGVNCTGYDAKSLGTVTTTAGTCAAQDVLVAQLVKVGSGQDAPAGHVAVVWYPANE